MRNEKGKLDYRWGIGIFGLLLFLAMISPEPEAPTTVLRPWQGYVTIDGMEGGQLTCPTVNVWNNYTSRDRVVARVSHGTRVEFVRRSGNAVLIKTPNGAQGWVTDYFIREFK